MTEYTYIGHMFSYSDSPGVWEVSYSSAICTHFVEAIEAGNGTILYKVYETTGTL